MSEIKIDYLTRKLFEAGMHLIDGSEQEDNSLMPLYGSKTLREAEAILVIKQLQEKVSSFLSFLIFLICINKDYLVTFPLLSVSWKCGAFVQITALEMERSSSQQNLDSVVEIATEQTISAREKHEEVIRLSGFMYWKLQL